MNNYSVFMDINKDEIAGLTACFNSYTKKYNKGDNIINSVERFDFVGIVESGLVYLVTIDHDGEENIIEYFEKGEIFAKEFSPNTNENLYLIIAKTSCTINFFSYSKIIECCNNHCQKHIKFINNLMITPMRKSQIHIDILSQRTIRNKLIKYFNYLKNKNMKNEIQIPLPLSDLADYIAVDRSAMMREIRKLNEEKIISSKGRSIIIL